MKPVHFPEETSTLAKGQPQYGTLPVAIRPTGPLIDDPKQFHCKYKLSEIELAQILKTQHVYIGQLVFGLLQPISASIESPFAQLPCEYEKKKHDQYCVWVPLKDGAKQLIEAKNPVALIDAILKEFPELTAEQIFFVDRATMAIGSQGLHKI